MLKYMVIKYREKICSIILLGVYRYYFIREKAFATLMYYNLNQAIIEIIPEWLVNMY